MFEEIILHLNFRIQEEFLHPLAQFVTLQEHTIKNVNFYQYFDQKIIT